MKLWFMLISNVPYFKCTADCTFMYEAVYVVCMQKINVSLPECYLSTS